MVIIGLTGGIACGKSTVSHYFEQLGIPVIDTDIIAKQLVEPGKPALQEITQIFGNDILDNNKQLNRKLLRDIIFNSPTKRYELEIVLHPKIRARVLEILASINHEDKSDTPPYCIIVIPLFFETKFHYPIDRILLVNCNEQKQIERTMLRDNITREQCLAIINSQISHSERLKKSDDVIENITDLESCYNQINAIHKKYQALTNKD
jgi:dephospho-CoA kinase